MDRSQALLRLPDVDALLDLITEGAYDEHLEDILSAAHTRKRVRRSTAVRWPREQRTA